MEGKKENIILGIILTILMITAISIVIINPNKTEKITETNQNIQQEDKNEQNKNIEQINDEEEKEESMHVGGKFCKIENKIVFYQDINKSIYLYNIYNNTTSKLATLENGAEKIYFDGQNIYCIPSYYMGKGIYKVDLQGNVEKIYEGTSLQLWITEEKIYFVKQIGYDEINGNPQGTICVMDKDGTNIIEIVENVKNDFYLQNNKIYYTTQDRKMYEINIEGTNPINLVNGRKFVIDTAEKYVLYIDYADQEAKHILNLETSEDRVIGYFGTLKKYQGKTYINVRGKLDDGSLSNDYRLFEIQKNGTIKDIGDAANFSTQIKYITGDKIYLYNQQEGVYTINLENNQKESAESYNNCKYFLGGYGYKIDDANIDDIKIERIEL